MIGFLHYLAMAAILTAVTYLGYVIGLLHASWTASGEIKRLNTLVSSYEQLTMKALETAKQIVDGKDIQEEVKQEVKEEVKDGEA